MQAFASLTSLILCLNPFGNAQIKSAYSAIMIDRMLLFIALAITVCPLAYTTVNVITKNSCVIAILLLLFGIPILFAVKKQCSGLVIVLLIKGLPMVPIGLFIKDIYEYNGLKVVLTIIRYIYGNELADVINACAFSTYYILFIVLTIMIKYIIGKRESVKKLTQFAKIYILNDDFGDVIWFDLQIVVAFISTVVMFVLSMLLYNGAYSCLLALSVVVGIGYILLKDEFLKLYNYVWCVESIRITHSYITKSFEVHKNIINWFPFIQNSLLSYLGFDWVNSGSVYFTIVLFEYFTSGVFSVYYRVSKAFGVVRENPIATVGVVTGIVGVTGLVVSLLMRRDRRD